MHFKPVMTLLMKFDGNGAGFNSFSERALLNHYCSLAKMNITHLASKSVIYVGKIIYFLKATF